MTTAKVFSFIFLFALQQLVLSIDPCPICESAKERETVDNCKICVKDGDVCCVCDGQDYFCQKPDAATASGGMMDALLNQLLGGLGLGSLVPPVCGLLKGLGLQEALKGLLTCLQENPDTSITGSCKPPPDTSGPKCTSGLCCTG